MVELNPRAFQTPSKGGSGWIQREKCRIGLGFVFCFVLFCFSRRDRHFETFARWEGGAGAPVPPGLLADPHPGGCLPER